MQGIAGCLIVHSNLNYWDYLIVHGNLNHWDYLNDVVIESRGTERVAFLKRRALQDVSSFIGIYDNICFTLYRCKSAMATREQADFSEFLPE